MKGIVIYKGKYGATRQYASWIGEALELPVVAADNLPGDQLPVYDFVVIGASVYIGKLQIQEWLTHNQAALVNKKIFLFQVAGTPPDERDKLQAYIRSGVPAAILKNCDIYFFHGKLSMKELSLKDRLLLKAGALLARDPKVRKEMLTEYNRVKIESIAGLVGSVRSFLGSAQKKKEYAA